MDFDRLGDILLGKFGLECGFFLYGSHELFFNVKGVEGFIRGNMCDNCHFFGIFDPMYKDW
jgi:hypothetical protein